MPTSIIRNAIYGSKCHRFCIELFINIFALERISVMIYPGVELGWNWICPGEPGGAKVTVRQDSSTGTRKKDGLARTNNQKAPPVIISCQSSSFLAQSQPLRTYVAAPFKSAHVMHSTNDPLGELKRVSRIKHPAAGRSERNLEGIISVQ